MNVLFVDVDSLRPYHVGAYGYDSPTTPTIDALAADAVRFERAYAANSPCMPSRAALLTGRYGVANGIETHGPPAQVVSGPDAWRDFDGDPAEWWTLPECFFRARIPAVAVTSFPRHPAPWFYDVWDEFHQPREPAGRGEYFQTVRAEAVVDHGLYTAQRAIRTDRWKLVHTLHDGPWDLPEWSLYDLDADPWEQADVAGEQPEVVERLRREMAVWTQRHVGRDGDPLREVAREGPWGLSYAG